MLKEPNGQLVTVSVGFMLLGLLFLHVLSLIQHMGVYKSIYLSFFGSFLLPVSADHRFSFLSPCATADFFFN